MVGMNFTPGDQLELTMPPKVKSMISSNVLLRTIQLLFERFFRIYRSFQEILTHYLERDIYIHIQGAPRDSCHCS